jgi:peptidoglycan/LPS O-acetylase OafA/YrhL
VFVVLSGVVLGMVYGPRLARNGLRFVVHRLGRRALTLYFAFVGVTLSVLALALAGVDVSAVASWDESAMSWFIDPRSMTTQNWRDCSCCITGRGRSRSSGSTCGSCWRQCRA